MERSLQILKYEKFGFARIVFFYKVLLDEIPIHHIGNLVLVGNSVRIRVGV